MKKVCAITLFTAIVLAVAVSGCTGMFGGPGQSTPVPTVYGPVSPSPTTAPTTTPIPAIAHSKSSNDVCILTSSQPYKVVKQGRTLDGKQYENISLFVFNDGKYPARDVRLVVTIISEYTMNTLVYQEFEVGDLANGDFKQLSLLTDSHDPCNFIKMTIEIVWGESREFYNSNEYENTYSFSI